MRRTMEKGKHSEQEEDTLESDVDISDDGGASSGDGNVLRKRVTFDANQEQSEKKRSKKTDGASDNQSSMGTVLVVITLAFVAISSMGFYYNTTNQSNDIDPEWVVEQLTKNIRILRSKFPAQSTNIWADFYSGIQKVLLEKPTEPSVFLLIHQGPEATSSCLARKVGRVAHALLDAPKPDLFNVDGAALGKNKAFTEDNKLLARTLVEGHRVVILDNLQLVPATLARGLMVFCDSITPLVDQAVYVFTLKISNADDKGKPEKLAQRELHSLWNKLDKTTLDPLVSCITGGKVFKIEPEKHAIDGC